MAKPKFRHDCDQCIFLGTTSVSSEPEDVYHCPSEAFSKEEGGSIIVRYGNEGHEYGSMPVALIRQHPEFQEAKPAYKFALDKLGASQ